MPEKFAPDDVTYDVSDRCKTETIYDCCSQAIERGVQSLGATNVARAALKVTCTGPIEGLGCQAMISGELFDANGDVVESIDTTARELLAPQAE